MFDILITGCTLLTMNPKNEIVADCDIGISDGRIQAIGRNLNAQAEKVLDGRDRYVLPGFINTHTHHAVCRIVRRCDVIKH